MIRVFGYIKLFFKYYLSLYRVERKSILSKIELSAKYGIHFHPRCSLQLESKDLFSAEEGSYIDAYAIINAYNAPGKQNTAFHLGRGSSIGEFSNIRASGGRVQIGQQVQISQHINIIASNHLMEKGSPIVQQGWSEEDNFVIIEDDVWIGCGAILLPGTHIKKGAVIAAGSVVKGEIPEYAIAAGIPAKVKKFRSE